MVFASRQHIQVFLCGVSSTRSLFVSFALLASTAAVAAPNLVTNGDFSAGNSGFTTDYVLNTASGVDEGVYDVRTAGGSVNGYHPSWADYGDHTTGTGLYMIANGASDTTDRVWQSGSIAISANTNYFFEAFLSNICCNATFTGPNAQPALTFTVSLDGGAAITLDSLTIPVGSTGIWYPLSTSFNSGTATSAVLTLVNAQGALSGNDFGLDDVFLGEETSVVPAPASIALFGLGLVALGAARRRTR